MASNTKYDDLQQKIYNQLTVGQEFRSWNALYNELGYSNLSGGKQKLILQRKILQYINIEKVSAQKIKVSEIYSEPHLAMDQRGRAGIYVGYIKRTLLYHLNEIDKDCAYLSYDVIAEVVGAVNKYFPHYYQRYSQIQKQNLKLEPQRVDAFVTECRSINRSIDSAINQLESEHIITADKIFIFTLDDNKIRMSTKREAECLRRIEHELRNELPYKQWETVFDDKIKDIFYETVKKRFAEETDISISKYFPTIQIRLVDRTKAALNASKDKNAFIEDRKCLNELVKLRLRNNVGRDLTNAEKRVNDYETNERKLMLIGDADWRTKHELLPPEIKRYLRDEDSVQMQEDLIKMLVDLNFNGFD